MPKSIGLSRRDIGMPRAVAWCFDLGLAIILTTVGWAPGIAATPHAAQIFVTDLKNNRIVRINDMAWTGWITFGSSGKGRNQFSNPTGIAVTAGRIFVVDSDNHRIVRINDMTGIGWTTFGRRGRGVSTSYGYVGTEVNEFYRPRGIAVTATGQIFVTDILTHRIVRINDMTGTGWTTFGSFGKGKNQFNNPSSIAVTPAGQIFVTDAGNARIVRIDDMTGTGWTTFGTDGRGVNQFVNPAGIAVTAAGQIFISDGLVSRIVRINDMAGAG